MPACRARETADLTHDCDHTEACRQGVGQGPRQTADAPGLRRLPLAPALNGHAADSGEPVPATQAVHKRRGIALLPANERQEREDLIYLVDS
jgi:hypothetical protein